MTDYSHAGANAPFAGQEDRAARFRSKKRLTWAELAQRLARHSRDQRRAPRINGRDGPRRCRGRPFRIGGRWFRLGDVAALEVSRESIPIGTVDGWQRYRPGLISYVLTLEADGQQLVYVSVSRHVDDAQLASAGLILETKDQGGTTSGKARARADIWRELTA